jgi:hypothetical protein
MDNKLKTNTCSKLELKFKCGNGELAYIRETRDGVEVSIYPNNGPAIMDSYIVGHDFESGIQTLTEFKDAIESVIETMRIYTKASQLKSAVQ